MKILWFRRDLRVEDSLLLSFGGEVMPIFIFDTDILNSLNKDDKRVSFIYQKVQELKTDLQKLGLDLYIFHGKPVEIFTRLQKLHPTQVIATVDYDSYALQRDKEVAKIVPLQTWQDSFIFDVDEVLKDDSSPYLVFTPYFKKAKQIYTPAHSKAYERKDHTLFTYKTKEISLQEMGFDQNPPQIKPPNTLLAELKTKLNNYQNDRDQLSVDATSHLSPHLRFGTISIRKLLRFLTTCKKEGLQTHPFFRQLVFRDFYASLLYHFPQLEKNDHKKLVDYRFDTNYYNAFTQAKTGVPIIDAGIKELINTGKMHNRVRMVTASFFTKHLLLPWQKGEEFFSRYLLDYEKSSNVLSWQWAAGTGIDPQPYFRIFNPYTQSKTYDKNARYIKKWLPQLKDVEAKKLHDENFLLQNTLPNYPKPILNHKQARQRALQAKL